MTLLVKYPTSFSILSHLEGLFGGHFMILDGVLLSLAQILRQTCIFNLFWRGGHTFVQQNRVFPYRTNT
jgi:hypothetical protein